MRPYPILFECDVAVYAHCDVTILSCKIQSLVGQYTFTGMADMYSIFSHAYSEEVAAHHIYQDPFPNH